eukprot:Plantae.Rhodophyta-Purpureofilum_apyrenoidigerum.ctg23285.p1 GENE.Plantae.Rhodophyta-Purpureofilum_apyrenoidigerum.ctg23285~~Plantae.Rhodophyta-Purpureofilum_apyrenoidigerum.ctg23285.p1  ORF type:complete len:250 (-),score=64.80 Plantae.Rhodophyta-Purpureofilum_apyrenoidigerum.ctg23285:287-1036(-)
MGSFLQSLNDKMRKASMDLAPKAQQLRDQMNEKWAELNSAEDQANLYVEDEPLAQAVEQLNAMRTAFHEIVAAVNNHYNSLRKEAEAEKKLGEKILQVATFDKFYTSDAMTAHVAVGKAEINAALLIEKYAAEMNTPLQHLNRGFEERYMKLVVPLKKRYHTLKTNYLRDKRSLERNDDDTLRARAEAAKPIWMEASKLLRAESTALTEAIASNLANWTSKMVSLHRDGLLAMTDTFKEATSIQPGLKQ